MKINKEILKEAILEILKEQEMEAEAPPEMGAREKKVARAATAGATMSPEEYMGMLKQVLTTPKVTAQVRKKALEGLFGQRGSAINSLVLQMIKGGQQ
jgi:hypothetical protein